MDVVDSLSYLSLLCYVLDKCDVHEIQRWAEAKKIAIPEIEAPYIGRGITWQALFYLAPIAIVVAMVLIKLQKNRVIHITRVLESACDISPELFVSAAFGGVGRYRDVGLKGKTLYLLREGCVFALMLVAIAAISACLGYFASRVAISAFSPARLFVGLVGDPNQIRSIAEWNWMYEIFRDAPIALGMGLTVVSLVLAVALLVGPIMSITFAVSYGAILKVAALIASVVSIAARLCGIGIETIVVIANRLWALASAGVKLLWRKGRRLWVIWEPFGR